MTVQFIAIAYPPNDFREVVQVGKPIHTIGPAFHSPEEAAKQLAMEFEDIYENDLDLTGFIIEVHDGIVEDAIEFDPVEQGYYHPQRRPNPSFAGMAPFMFSTAHVPVLGAHVPGNEASGEHPFARIPTSPQPDHTPRIPYSHPEDVDSLEDRVFARMDERFQQFEKRIAESAAKYSAALDSDTTRGTKSASKSKSKSKSKSRSKSKSTAKQEAYKKSEVNRIIQEFLEAKGNTAQVKALPANATDAVAKALGKDVTDPTWQDMNAPERRVLIRQWLEDAEGARAAKTGKAPGKPKTKLKKMDKGVKTSASTASKSEFSTAEVDEIIRNLQKIEHRKFVRAADLPTMAFRPVAERLGILDEIEEIFAGSGDKGQKSRRAIYAKAQELKEANEAPQGKVTPRKAAAKRPKTSPKAPKAGVNAPTKEQVEAELEAITGEERKLGTYTPMEAAEAFIDAYNNSSGNRKSALRKKFLLPMRKAAGITTSGRYGAPSTAKDLKALYNLQGQVIEDANTEPLPDEPPKTTKAQQRALKKQEKARTEAAQPQAPKDRFGGVSPTDRVLAALLVKQADSKDACDPGILNRGKFEKNVLSRAKVTEQQYENALKELLDQNKIQIQKASKAQRERGITRNIRVVPTAITEADLDMIQALPELSQRKGSGLKRLGNLYSGDKGESRIEILVTMVEDCDKAADEGMTEEAIEDRCAVTIRDAAKLLDPSDVERIDDIIAEEFLTPVVYAEIKEMADNEEFGSSPYMNATALLNLNFGLWAADSEKKKNALIGSVLRANYGEDLADIMGAYLIRKGFVTKTCAPNSNGFTSDVLYQNYKAWERGEQPVWSKVPDSAEALNTTPLQQTGSKREEIAGVTVIADPEGAAELAEAMKEELF